MDASLSPFFVAGVLGILCGFVAGRLQREYRFRRDSATAVRRNLAAGTDRLPNVGTDLGSNLYLGTVPRTDGNGYDDGPADRLRAVRRGARARAVRGDNLRVGAGAVAAGRYSGGSDAPPVSARGWEFDGD